MSRAFKSATIRDVLVGRMITDCRASLSCIAASLVPADYFAVSQALAVSISVYRGLPIGLPGGALPVILRLPFCSG